MSQQDFIDNIDDRYVDVDFTKEEPYVFGDLGGLAFAGRLPVFEDNFPLLSEAEIDAAIEAKMAADLCGADYVTRIMNQGQEGSCVGNMLAQALECLQAKQYGKDAVIPISAISLYKQIGRSPSSGATIPDGWEAVTIVGGLPLDTPENRARFGDQVMPHTGFRTPYPNNWRDTAKLLRVGEGYVIRSERAYWTALCKDWFVGVGREGHSVLQTDPLRYRGSRASRYANSWRESWGLAYKGFSGGFGIDTARQIRQSANWAIAFRSIKAPWAA